MDMTDVQWDLIKGSMPEDAVREDGRGRPWSDPRKAFNGILWILRTGAPWKDLPGRYGAYQTVHRRFQRWRKEGVMALMLGELARDLHERGGLDLSECFIDGSFSAAKKGASKLAKPSVARVSKSWQLEMLMVFRSPSTQKLLPQQK
jgi:transposase